VRGGSLVAGDTFCPPRRERGNGSLLCGGGGKDSGGDTASKAMWRKNQKNCYHPRPKCLAGQGRNPHKKRLGRKGIGVSLVAR